MSNFVLLSTYYLNIPSANGICARNIVNQLRQRGHKVFVVCYGNHQSFNSNSDEYIYTIPTKSTGQPHNIVQKIARTAKVAMGSFEPIIDEELTNNYYNAISEINNKHSIDGIIAMYFPFESVEAMIRFLKQGNNIKSIMVELDSVGDGVSNSKLLGIYDRVYERWLKKVYSIVTATIIMKSHEEYWKKLFYSTFANKLLISDIPVLTSRDYIYVPSEKINMIYSGIIDKRYRSPEYLLDILKKLSTVISFSFDFYSKGDCENDISDAKLSINGINQHGYVEPEILESALEKADFLVNIGNALSRSVPSKLITYISYGKPIIHFASQQNDVCIDYLRRYPNALIVDQSNPVEVSFDQLIAFIENNIGKHIPYEIIEQEYYMNDPQYSADLICKILI